MHLPQGTIANRSKNLQQARAPFNFADPLQPGLGSFSKSLMKTN